MILIILFNFFKRFVSMEKKRERKLELMGPSGRNVAVNASVRLTNLK